MAEQLQFTGVELEQESNLHTGAIDTHGMPPSEPWYELQDSEPISYHGPFTVRHRSPENEIRVSNRGPRVFDSESYRYYTGQFVDSRDGSIYNLAPRIVAADAKIDDILTEQETDKVMLVRPDEYVISTEPAPDTDSPRTGAYYVFKPGLGVSVRKQGSMDRKFIPSPRVENVDPKLKKLYQEALISIEKRNVGIGRGAVTATLDGEVSNSIRKPLQDRPLPLE